MRAGQWGTTYQYCAPSPQVQPGRKGRMHQQGSLCTMKRRATAAKLSFDLPFSRHVMQTRSTPTPPARRTWSALSSTSWPTPQQARRAMQPRLCPFRNILAHSAGAAILLLFFPCVLPPSPARLGLGWLCWLQGLTRWSLPPPAPPAASPTTPPPAPRARCAPGTAASRGEQASPWPSPH